VEDFRVGLEGDGRAGLPGRLYALLSNFAPAPTVVSTTSSVGRPTSGCTSTGMPRPSSVTLKLPST
jgi:hypothetical protein